MRPRKRPRPSKSVFTPIIIRMHPPMVPALFTRSAPNLLPMTAPQKLIANVTTPMMMAGTRTSKDSMDMDMPTTRASMLVATASVAMVTSPMSPLSSSFPKKSSRIMLRPIRSRMANAIQWA